MAGAFLVILSWYWCYTYLIPIWYPAIQSKLVETDLRLSFDRGDSFFSFLHLFSLFIVFSLFNSIFCSKWHLGKFFLDGKGIFFPKNAVLIGSVFHWTKLTGFPFNNLIWLKGGPSALHNAPDSYNFLKRLIMQYWDKLCLKQKLYKCTIWNQKSLIVAFPKSRPVAG